jgi:uncharacterized protein (DUF2252 family)
MLRPVMSIEHDPATRVARGRSARREVPRSAHAEWQTGPGRTHPSLLLAEQEATRVPDLVPLRHERMLASPFTFYRGAATIMAADLSTTPVSGIAAQCCGDAHLANFGGFESPERSMVFDINDFDETLRGPWEWDVKRLAASIAIAGQDREFDDALISQSVLDATRSYREAIRSFAGMSNLGVWYTRLDVQGVIERWRKKVSASDIKRLERNVEKARSKNSVKAFNRLSEQVDGELRIANDPPTIVRMHDLVPPDHWHELAERVEGWLGAYSSTLQNDRARLVGEYRPLDIARKVVGVGSVGTRCWILLMIGRDESDPLFLQVKEAEASVLEPFLERSDATQHGERVVRGQRLMQAASDVFLGWFVADGLDGIERHFYVRQMWDGKLSADLTTMPSSLLPVYAQMCGWTLARAHARSGDRIAIGAYLGSGDVFDRAMVEFATAYAAQNERDYRSVVDALR